MKNSLVPRLAFIGLSLGVVAAAVLPMVVHSPPTLLRHATKIAALGQWLPRNDNYFWEDSRRILVLKPRDVPFGTVTPSLQASVVDVTTRQISEASKLEEAFRRVSSPADIPEWQLSPDGKWLLGWQISSNNGPRWVITALDGARQWFVPNSELDSLTDDEPYIYLTTPIKDTHVFLRPVFWDLNSRSWLRLTSSHNGALLTRYKIGSPKPTQTSLNFMPDSRVVVGFVSPGRVLCLYHDTGDGGGIGFVNFPSIGTAPVDIYYEHIPANMDVREVALSPDGKYLAWKLAVKPLLFGLESSRNSSYVRHSRPDAVGLWVSKLDCTDLREIGTAGAESASLSNLRWSPDDTRLSFIYQNALYTVPVD